MGFVVSSSAWVALAIQHGVLYTPLCNICHLRLHGAPPTTPLYHYFDRTWRSIMTMVLTKQLRLTVTTMGASYGILPNDISIRSLRSSGAMALLCARVDTDTIRLLGRWHLDEMLCYVHVQAFPLVTPLASQMLRQGSYTLIPNTAL